MAFLLSNQLNITVQIYLNQNLKQKKPNIASAPESQAKTPYKNSAISSLIGLIQRY